MIEEKKSHVREDRKREAAREGYEVKYFAAKHRLTIHEARELIERVGPDRFKLNEAVEKMKARYL